MPFLAFFTHTPILMASVYGPLHIRSVDLRAVPVSGLEILPYEHFSLPWLPEPVFFSRATKSFVGHRSFTRAAKPWQKPETEREKPLVPRVTSAQLQGCKLDEFLRSGWHCLALPSYFPHDKLHHNCSDTSLRLAEIMIGAKVVCFVSRIWHHAGLVSRIFGLSLSRKPGWNFSYEPKGHPRQNSSR